MGLIGDVITSMWEMISWNAVQLFIIAVAVFFVIRFVRNKHDDVE
jgi:large-conductance mechanosensitive channel